MYDKKIFFIDDYDNSLKIYDLDEESFTSKYLSLEDIGTIVDAYHLDNYLFILTNNEDKSFVYSVDLTDFEKTYKSYEEEIIHKKLAVTEITDATATYYVFSLTPEEITADAKPQIVFVDQTTIVSQKTFDINLDSSPSLVKFFTIPATVDEEHLNLIYYYDASVYYSTFALTDFDSQTTLSAVPKLIRNNITDDTNSKITISNINLIEIDSKSYFLITYANGSRAVNESYSRIYEYNIALTDTDTKFGFVDEIEGENNPFVLTSKNYVLYPNADNNIVYTNIKATNSGSGNIEFSRTKITISNPKITAIYYTEPEFKYYSTNKETFLLEYPYDKTSPVLIPNATDVIIIGQGKIKDDQSPIPNYAYCLYTVDGQNLKGYIHNSYLTEKSNIVDDDYYSKIMPEFRVVDKTKLYSLPTKVTGDKITDTLISESKEISGKSKVILKSLLFGYTTSIGRLIEVEVDGVVGYIDPDQIIYPSSQNEFVITNAKIKIDGTRVYKDPNASSELIAILDKGYTIRIDGPKNTKSGYTKITFNDEYGNEFTGYILTDSLASDNWSTLQIIGCILIAINIGLLVLILKFKNERIGKNGQKYVKNKKPNYKETPVQNIEE